mmetsp:Transcript_51958/g.104521  ORF Transcript_51958/g.104521 Transcript_51958/m.104521 type:complete len:110 (+) Transcript_51958:219-548(+)
MERLAEGVEALRTELGEGPEKLHVAQASLTSLDVARGAFRAAAGALGAEAALRRSLLDAFAELRPGQEDERRRLHICWVERPFTPPEEGAQLDRLRRGAAEALERLASA